MSIADPIRFGNEPTDTYMTRRVVDVDGIPMSALCAEVADPLAVIIAVHGGATSSAYFDLPQRPQLSLLRAGVDAGYTVISLDRPGYGSSAPDEDAFATSTARVDACYGAIDALLGSSSRGAGVFLVAHSAGCDLGVAMAVDDRGDRLLGLELAGTGLHKHPDAAEVIAQMSTSPERGGIRDLLWYPPELYPPEVIGGKLIAASAPGYESTVVHDWPHDFRSSARHVRIPIRFTCAQYERVWRCDTAALTEIEALFTGAPRFVANVQPHSGHNISVGFGATAYHLGILSFLEACILERANGAEETR